MVKLLSRKKFVFDLQRQYKTHFLSSNSKAVHKNINQIYFVGPQRVARRCSVKACFLNLFKIHRKRPVLESFFKKVSGLRPRLEACKKGTPTRVLSCKLCKIFKNTLFIELLL